MAELLGKATGISKGKGGSMHMASVEKNFWGGHAIVGGHLPVAAGFAIGDQYAENDNVTICMFGDGATNIGYFHEALNIAKTWGLRVFARSGIFHLQQLCTQTSVQVTSIHCGAPAAASRKATSLLSSPLFQRGARNDF